MQQPLQSSVALQAPPPGIGSQVCVTVLQRSPGSQSLAASQPQCESARHFAPRTLPLQSGFVVQPQSPPSTTPLQTGPFAFEVQEAQTVLFVPLPHALLPRPKLHTPPSQQPWQRLVPLHAAPATQRCVVVLQAWPSWQSAPESQPH